MLETSVIEGTSVVTVTYDGSVDADEMKSIRTTIERVAGDAGTAQVLIDWGEIDLSRIEPKALWERLKTTGVFDTVDKLAFVTDRGWLEKIVSMIDRATPVEAQAYGKDERDAAVAWLSTGQTPGRHRSE